MNEKTQIATVNTETETSNHKFLEDIKEFQNECKKMYDETMKEMRRTTRRKLATMKVVKKMIFFTLAWVCICFIKSYVVFSISGGMEELEHKLICRDDDGYERNLTEQQIIISSQSELESLLEKMSSVNSMNKWCSESLMKIDLTQNDLIFISDRERPSSGYSIEIADIKKSKEDDLVTINYSLLGRQEGGIFAAVMTQPYLFEKVPKLNSQVRFVLQEKQHRQRWYNK